MERVTYNCNGQLRFYILKSFGETCVTASAERRYGGACVTPEEGMASSDAVRMFYLYARVLRAR